MIEEFKDVSRNMNDCIHVNHGVSFAVLIMFVKEH